MTTGIDVVYDATHANVGSLPTAATYAGYTTGVGSVPWTDADWAKYPDAIRIDQSQVKGEWDAKADVDDYENGAVLIGELAMRAKLRMISFRNNSRPGQRMPVIYASASNLPSVVNALIKGGVKSGVGLWVANWNLTEPASIATIVSASGPFPIVGVQFHRGITFDISVFSIAWLTNRSTNAPAKPVVPPGQWLDANAWSWHSAALSGIGLDGKKHQFTFVPSTGGWLRIS